MTEALIVMLSVPFALVGGAWLMRWFGYKTSVAVAVGFIALAGVTFAHSGFENFPNEPTAAIMASDRLACIDLSVRNIDIRFLFAGFRMPRHCWM